MVLMFISSVAEVWPGTVSPILTLSTITSLPPAKATPHNSNSPAVIELRNMFPPVHYEIVQGCAEQV
jgi:hypothetical protein